MITKTQCFAANTGIPIQLKGVIKGFRGNNVLRSLNFAIPAGQFVTIVGHSGCGKSTLLRLLANLDSPTSGEITVAKQPLSNFHGDIRIMFQEPRLLPWKTVIENVALGLNRTSHNEALKVLASVGLSDKAGEWPEELSGGQKQRVALARALIHQPRLLLLDEPFGALDALTRMEMQQLLIKLWHQYQFTVVLVTHDIHEAVWTSERVLMLKEGMLHLDININENYPRSLTNAFLIDLESQVLNALTERKFA